MLTAVSGPETAWRFICRFQHYTPNGQNPIPTGIKAGVDAFLIKLLDGALLEAQVTIATRIVGLQEHARRLEAIITVSTSSPSKVSV